MGGAAGFHHDPIYTAIGKPAFELMTRQPMRFGDLPGAVGQRQLDDVLGEIHTRDVAPAMISVVAFMSDSFRR